MHPETWNPVRHIARIFSRGRSPSKKFFIIYVSFSILIFYSIHFTEAIKLWKKPCSDTEMSLYILKSNFSTESRKTSRRGLDSQTPPALAAYGYVPESGDILFLGRNRNGRKHPTPNTTITDDNERVKTNGILLRGVVVFRVQPIMELIVSATIFFRTPNATVS